MVLKRATTLPKSENIAVAVTATTTARKSQNASLVRIEEVEKLFFTAVFFHKTFSNSTITKMPRKIQGQKAARLSSRGEISFYHLP
jgi:hypothetical protein